MSSALLFVLSAIIFRVVSTTNISIVLTYTHLDFTRLGLIFNQNLQLSQCPANNYTVTFVQFNETQLYQSPINTNNFQNIYLIFGPDRVFGPTFFGFPGSITGFSFASAFLSTFYLDFETRYKIMLSVVDFTLQNDVVKSVAFIINASTNDLMETWKTFNPHKYLSSFRGSLTILYYANASDAVRIANEIKTRALINVVMDLDFNGTYTVLQACNARNLLNWRQRWMIFFSLLPYLPLPTVLNFPLSANFTAYDFGRIANVNPTYVSAERDVHFYDICYTIVKLMDSSNCNANNVGTLALGTGNFTFDGSVIQRSSWFIQSFQYSGSINIVGNVTAFPNGTIIVNQPIAPIISSRTTAQVLQEMQSKPFRVAAMMEKPFVYYDQNGTLTGYSIETINIILKNLNLTGVITTYTLPTGRLQNGIFSGILGVLQNGQADIVIGPITYFPQYSNYITFTMQFKPYSLAVIYSSNTTTQYQQMFEFIYVFSWEVWLMIIGSCLVYAAALTIVNLISPNEARMNLMDTFLFTLGSIIQGVTTALPDKVSGRILVIFWWIFNIVILLAYVTNYGSNRTYIRLQADINDVSSLLSQNMFSYGTIINSSVDEYFATSQSQQFQQLYTMMGTVFINDMTNSTEASIATVKQKLYAFIYQDAVLNQFTANKCLAIKTSTEQLFYAYALVDSDYTNIINSQLTNLTSTGVISKLDAQFFQIFNPPSCTSTDWLGTVLNILNYEFLKNPANSLNIQQTAGIFVIMLIGIIISMTVAVIEFIVKKCRKNPKKKSESHA